MNDGYETKCRGRGNQNRKICSVGKVTHSSSCLAAILGLHLGQPLVGVLQQLLDAVCVFLLQLKLLLLHLSHECVQLAVKMNILVRPSP